MFARLLVLVVTAVALASCVTARPAAPITPASLAERRAACAGKDGWSDPAPPVRVLGNLYDVGTCGITVLLLTGEAGHILFDGGPADAAPLVAANIERLGLNIADVKWIVTSHEHFDHVGGVAELQRRSGARVAAVMTGADALRSGRNGPDDPQFGRLDSFPAIRVDRVLADGEQVTLGNLALTAYATPGHAPGSTSWTFAACAGATCRTVAYADSVTSISADGYLFADHPAYIAAFRAGLAKIGALPCDILVTPHPGSSALFERLAGDKPLVDPKACADYARLGGQRLDERLAKEAK